MKIVKLIILAISFIIFLIMQICINPIGYNYLVFYVIILATVFFDDIKTLSVGIFKLEKYEKLAKYIDNTIVSFYMVTLNEYINEHGGNGFKYEDVILPKYHEIKELVTQIQINNKMPDTIKSKLTSYVKNIANKCAQRQFELLHKSSSQDKISAASYDYSELVDPMKLSLSELKKNHQNINATSDEVKEAIEAYKYLYDLSKNGIL